MVTRLMEEIKGEQEIFYARIAGYRVDISWNRLHIARLVELFFKGGLRTMANGLVSRPPDGLV